MAMILTTFVFHTFSLVYYVEGKNNGKVYTEEEKRIGTAIDRVTAWTKCTVHIQIDLYSTANESEKVVGSGESEKWMDLTEQRCLLGVEQWMNEAVWKES